MKIKYLYIFLLVQMLVGCDFRSFEIVSKESSNNKGPLLEAKCFAITKVNWFIKDIDASDCAKKN